MQICVYIAMYPILLHECAVSLFNYLWLLHCCSLKALHECNEFFPTNAWSVATLEFRNIQQLDKLVQNRKYWPAMEKKKVKFFVDKSKDKNSERKFLKIIRNSPHLVKKTLSGLTNNLCSTKRYMPSCLSIYNVCFQNSIVLKVYFKQYISCSTL